MGWQKGTQKTTEDNCSIQASKLVVHPEVDLAASEGSQQASCGDLVGAMLGSRGIATLYPLHGRVQEASDSVYWPAVTEWRNPDSAELSEKERVSISFQIKIYK